MKFNILTLFPEAFSVFFKTSIIGNAVKNGHISYELINFRDYSTSAYKKVDDYTYGGGKGMLIQPDCVYKAYDDIVLRSGKKPKMIYMSPRGKVLDQSLACALAKEEELIILCGHYEGVDQRIIDELCDMELSIGDYVLTGGELPAMILCDSVSRLVPGVLSSDESYTGESHYNGLLEYDQYTRPETFNGISVPEVLISGNAKDVNSWRDNSSIENTLKNRPDLYYEKFGTLPETKDKEYNLNTVILGENKIACDEILSLYKKHNINGEVYTENSLEMCDFSQKTAVIVCGEYDIKTDKVFDDNKDNCILFQNLRPLSEKRISPCLTLKSFNYKPEKIFVTPKEFALEVLRYCDFCDSGRDFDKPVISNVKFLCSIPYMLFETYGENFKKLNPQKMFCVETNNRHFRGKTKLIFDTYDVDCTFYSFKSALYGRIQFAYVDENDEVLARLFSPETNGTIKGYIK